MENELSGLDTHSMNDFALGLNCIREFINLTVACRHIDREYRLRKREEVITTITKIKTERDDFENKKRTVIENNEEWTEGEFNQVVPNDPEMEIDNDIE